VLLPTPNERPALTIYQEAGHFLGGGLRVWQSMVFGEKWRPSDSKTGRAFCLEIMQNSDFAYLLGRRGREKS
jgi:hypothetical protein